MLKIDLYLESGQKRTFASAVDWPGWCRSGRDEASALQTLLDYGPRYARAIHSAGVEFQPPAGLSAFHVLERLEGSQTTDFGAPGAIAAGEARPVEEAELLRFEALLKAIWQTFDDAAAAAQGKALRKGPRGGGRELDGMLEHVLGSEAGYLGQLGWKLKNESSAQPGEAMAQLREAILEGMQAAARGQIPARGPRGGLRWPLPYFVRRSAWHVLDHAWELEDRVTDP